MSARVNGGQAVEQAGAEVEVDAVRLARRDAQLPALLALGLGERIRGLGRPSGPAGLLLGGVVSDLASSSETVRAIACLTSSRYSERSTISGAPRSNSIITPAARAWSTSASENRTRGAVGVAVKLAGQLDGALVLRSAFLPSLSSAMSWPSTWPRWAANTFVALVSRSAASSTQPGSRASRSAAHSLPSAR